ncbi:hypothetical protein ACLKA6_000471 [Drosophila palustris]
MEAEVVGDALGEIALDRDALAEIVLVRDALEDTVLEMDALEDTVLEMDALEDTVLDRDALAEIAQENAEEEIAKTLAEIVLALASSADLRLELESQVKFSHQVKVQLKTKIRNGIK